MCSSAVASSSMCQSLILSSFHQASPTSIAASAPFAPRATIGSSSFSARPPKALLPRVRSRWNRLPRTMASSPNHGVRSSITPKLHRAAATRSSPLLMLSAATLWSAAFASGAAGCEALSARHCWRLLLLTSRKLNFLTRSATCLPPFCPRSRPTTASRIHLARTRPTVQPQRRH